VVPTHFQTIVEANRDNDNKKMLTTEENHDGKETLIKEKN
jgi:hypothetical protein